jgi:uncharacterized membrane protein YkvA (DUF1232 family)
MPKQTLRRWETAWYRKIQIRTQRLISKGKRVMENLEKVGAKKRVKAMLRFMPNLIGLCGRLMVDSRVAKTDKALFASAVFYALAPLDFIPDFLPFIGQVDDAYLVALTLLRLVNRRTNPLCANTGAAAATP